MPNNEQARIPGASHELGLMEKPEVFNKLVLEFLSKHTKYNKYNNQIVGIIFVEL